MHKPVNNAHPSKVICTFILQTYSYIYICICSTWQCLWDFLYVFMFRCVYVLTGKVIPPSVTQKTKKKTTTSTTWIKSPENCHTIKRKWSHITRHITGEVDHDIETVCMHIHRDLISLTFDYNKLLLISICSKFCSFFYGFLVFQGYIQLLLTNEIMKSINRLIIVGYTFSLHTEQVYI